MIRVIRKTFRLLTFILAVGFLSANQVLHAQQSTTALTGEWVGNSEPVRPGRVFAFQSY